MRKSIFSKEQVEFLTENYKGISTKELTGLVNGKFNTNFIPQQILGFKSRLKLKSGYDRSNWNPMHRPVGTETLIANGYVMVKVAEPNMWKHKHHVVWQQANGPIPEGHLLIFLDNNQQNCELENLALVDKSTHGYMFKNDYYTDDSELTKAALGTSKLMAKIKEIEEAKEAHT